MRPSGFDFDVITDPEERRERRPWTPLSHVPPTPAPQLTDAAKDGRAEQNDGSDSRG